MARCDPAAGVSQTAVRDMLMGTLDGSSVLSALRGKRDVLEEVARRHEDALRAHVDRESVALWCPPALMDATSGVGFPPPTPGGLDVNMMPFRLDDIARTLPASLQGYVRMIASLPIVVLPRQLAYLTVHESLVRPGETQRRPGLHFERHGPVTGRMMRPSLAALELAAGGSPVETMLVDPQVVQMYALMRGRLLDADTMTCLAIRWGGGRFNGCLPKDQEQEQEPEPLARFERGYPVDGIWMCSRIVDADADADAEADAETPATTAVYPALVERPEEVSDADGGVEALRHLLGPPRLLRSNELCWLTDRTPHEALPYAGARPATRQFFRVVVGKVTVWFARHNTPNPLGVQPDRDIVCGVGPCRCRGAVRDESPPSSGCRRCTA
jgi:hypothetical protein